MIRARIAKKVLQKKKMQKIKRGYFDFMWKPVDLAYSNALIDVHIVKKPSFNEGKFQGGD